MSLWKRQKSLKTIEMELLRVFESKKALLQLSVTDSVTDSMLNLPILFHKKEINRESQKHE